MKHLIFISLLSILCNTLCWSQTEDTLYIDEYKFLASEDFFNENLYKYHVQPFSEPSRLVVDLGNFLTDKIVISVLENGNLTNQLSFPDDGSVVHLAFDYKPQNQYDVLLEIINKPPYNLQIKLNTEATFYKSQRSDNTLFGIYFGMLFLFLMFAVMSLGTRPSLMYFYYILYLLASLLFFSAENGFLPSKGVLSSNHEAFLFTVIFLSNIAALLFNRALMADENISIRWSYLDKVIITVSTILIIAIWTPLKFHPILFPWLYNIMLTTIILTFSTLVIRSLIYQPKKKIVKVLLIFGYTSLFIGIILKPFSFWALIEYNWFARFGSLFGQIIEIVCLSAILVLRNYWDSEEQLSIKMELESSQRKVLQSQMNPHFIFNALGAIQFFIQTNNSEKADEYLSDFAMLMRRILESSKVKYINIKQEIETLKLYVGLEQVRFENIFDYKFIVADDIDMDMHIPPMILQPFIENAINHGLYNLSDRKGELLVQFEQQDQDTVCITIRDNGVGRAAATKLRTKRHKARGMQIVNERVETINNSADLKVNITVRDLIEDDIPKGTEVVAIIHEPS